MKPKLVNIDTIRGAEYNPRIISDRQFEVLKESICDIGFVLPVIVNSRNNTLIAGYQRTRAAKDVGLTQVPCFFCDDITDGDEIRFNQLHNFTDTRDLVSVCEIYDSGFQEVDVDKFTEDETTGQAVELMEVCKLLNRYGNLLCAVSCNGKVIIGSRYIYACRLLKLPVNLYVIDANLYDKAMKYLNSDYGVFDYNKLKRHTYVQGLAQLHRLAAETDKRQNKSTLYTKYVIPYLNKNPKASVLDFGCGKGAYINALKNSGRIAVGVEFYNNNGSKILIDKGNSQIDALIRAIKLNGLFNVVVCDSVLNSVDSMEAYCSVLKCLNIFTDNKAFVSGRPRDYVSHQTNLKHRSGAGVTRNTNFFLDENGFTGTYRKGNWYYQQFSTREQVVECLGKAGLEADDIHWGENSFQVECSKVRELTVAEATAAINFEFTLPLPGGKQYARNNDVLEVLGLTKKSKGECV